MSTMTGVRQISYSGAINLALRESMRADPTVILMGEDIAGGAGIDHLVNEDAWGGAMGVTKGLVQEFGRDRVLDTPITEAGFIGAAVGAAATGLRPVAELMFVDFFGCCMDQIFDQGAKLRYMFGGKAKCPLVIRTMIGAGVNAAGQHSGCHYSVFTHMPGIKVRRAIDRRPTPRASALPRSGTTIWSCFSRTRCSTRMKGEVPEATRAFRSAWPTSSEPARDVTIVAISRMVHQALAAGEDSGRGGHRGRNRRSAHAFAAG